MKPFERTFTILASASTALHNGRVQIESDVHQYALGRHTRQKHDSSKFVKVLACHNVPCLGKLSVGKRKREESCKQVKGLQVEGREAKAWEGLVNSLFPGSPVLKEHLLADQLMKQRSRMQVPI